MESTLLFFQIIVLLFSIMVHEVAHGAVAFRLGDTTARDAGRLSLNPLKHLDPIGSILLPLFFILSGSRFMFGWAKPVPYNPFNLKNPKKGAAIIGIAGPLSNLALAVAFALITAFIPSAAPFFAVIVLINIVLAVFNLIPIPPLDGSRVLFSLLPDRFGHFEAELSRYGFFILILLLATGSFSFLSVIVAALFRLIMQLSFIF